MTRYFESAVVLIGALLLSSCANQFSERDLNGIASSLTKLSAAVDATVRYANPPMDASSQELIALSISSDPTLLTPFLPFNIQVRREGSNSSVLICSRDGRQALLEDAGCTARLDANLWKNHPPAICVSTLDLLAVCK